MLRPGTRPDRTNDGPDGARGPKDAAGTRHASGARRHRVPGQPKGSGENYAEDEPRRTEDDADARERRNDALCGLAILVLAAVLVGLLFWAL